jgi:hypothetical protein
MTKGSFDNKAELGIRITFFKRLNLIVRMFSPVFIASKDTKYDKVPFCSLHSQRCWLPYSFATLKKSLKAIRISKRGEDHDMHQDKTA